MVIKRRSIAPSVVELLEPPPVRPWSGRTQSRYALVTLATGEHGRELLKVSGPGLRRYAREIGCDFHAISGPPGPFPLARKWEVVRYMERYERVVWIDADVVLAPDTPSLLEYVPRGSIGIHSDWPWLTNREWVLAECRALCESQGYDASAVREVAWNTGVWVADREHLPVFAPPRLPYPRFHCVEQWHEQLRMAQLGVRVHLLPSQFNWQWWVQSREMVEPVAGTYVYHYAGLIGQPEERLRQMRELARRFEERG